MRLKENRRDSRSPSRVRVREKVNLLAARKVAGRDAQRGRSPVSEPPRVKTHTGKKTVSEGQQEVKPPWWQKFREKKLALKLARKKALDHLEAVALSVADSTVAMEANSSDSRGGDPPPPPPPAIEQGTGKNTKSKNKGKKGGRPKGSGKGKKGKNQSKGKDKERRMPWQR